MSATLASTPMGTDLPVAAEARLPRAGLLWRRVVILGWVLLAAFLLDRLALLLMDYWLLESLRLESVFWTNFKTGLVLFSAGLLSSAFVIGPAFAYPIPRSVRWLVVNGGLLWGVISGYLLSGEYFSFLMAEGVDFQEVDGVFGNDLGFYVFTLPPIWIAWGFLFAGTALAVVSWGFCAYLGRPTDGATDASLTRLGRVVGHLATRGTRVTFSIFGVLAAIGWWLARYDVLTADNSDSSVFVGAAYVDQVGLFSTVNDYHVTALLTLAATVLIVLLTGRLHRRARGEGPAGAAASVRKLAFALLILLCADFAFKGMVSLRQMIAVKPNEPVIQLPYIERHIEATRKAYMLNDIETVTFVPKDVGDPLPDVDKLLANPSLKNAPLWPGFVSYLEELIDPQHSKRVVQTGGETLVYGPLLEIFRQQQKLRAYYNFLDMDTIRYEVDGEARMLVSAVREVPLVEPAPWLAWWGQQFMLFTHGLGLVTASAGEVGPMGDPVYLSKGIPVQSRVPGLQPANQRVYYGEGAGSMAYSNVRDVEELDYPTDEGRATTQLPADVPAGVRIDSLLKRLVFGYKSGQFFEILFSNLLEDDTRVHYFRTPLERLQRVAPFLHWDTDPFAVPSGDRIVWIANGIVYSDSYPYSEYKDLGDKSDRRSPFPVVRRRANYVRDGVKATIDGYTGELKFYRFRDDPILATAAEVYPAMFTAADEMPDSIRRQLQYPPQLLHVQFDDLYITYQMRDPMTFFNMEDMWDDGDEVLGALIDQGHAIRFSIEPFYAMVQTGQSSVPLADPPVQFVQMMIFTPEKALNLRALPIVYQDGADYGRVVCLQVPKGHYFLGPEQADALIDQSPDIAQQISWWTRRGVEVLRGHTTALLVDGEVLYVEPIFLRSQQNPTPELKRVCVVFRGKAAMRTTLAEALRAAVDAHR